MTKQQPLKRIVTCQGSIQLVTALAAVKSRELETSTGQVEYEDYLIIYDLYAPEGQLEGFVDFVTSLARLLHDWKAVIFISPAQMEMLAATLKSDGRHSTLQALYDFALPTSVQEIYLCRNWQFGNQLLLNAYRDARKICYGDSIGIYFSEAYFSSAPQTTDTGRHSFSVRNRIRAVKHGLTSSFSRPTALEEIQFDLGYFVLPDILGQPPPMPVRLVDKQFSLAIFHQLSSVLDEHFVSRLRERVVGKQVLILMTSNFSEARRMTSEDEIAAYKEFLSAAEYPENVVLIIKPHPRDTNAKIEELKTALQVLFTEIIVLGEPEFFFAPFELFLLRTFTDASGSLQGDLKVVTFSTACLSLALLFRIESAIGFGETLVHKYFHEDYAAGRIMHEQDLAAAVQRIKSCV